MTSKPKLDLRHLILFSMLGTIQYLSKWVLEGIPNVELISTLTMVYTLVYRKQALIPIFVCILLVGIYPAGFGLWWYPYLYLWPLLWGVTMLLPRRLPVKVQVPVYAGVCALFGLAYGVLYAPYQSLVFLGGDLRKTLVWIAAGFFPWDLIHAGGNLALGLLIVPLAELLRRLEQSSARP